MVCVRGHTAVDCRDRSYHDGYTTESRYEISQSCAIDLLDLSVSKAKTAAFITKSICGKYILLCRLY